MKITYKNAKLERALTNDKDMVRTFGQLAKKIKQRINQLTVAENLSVIACLPALRLHPYKGDRIGDWSIDIFENWRIIFRIDQRPLPILETGGADLSEINTIHIISVEDPH